MTEDTQTPIEDAWWIAVDGQTSGPFEAADIIDGIATSRFSTDCYACPAGGDRWQPLLEWDRFKASVEASAGPPPPPPLPREAMTQRPSPHDPLVTNPALPRMGNLICVYCLVASPILWVLSVFGTLVSWSTLDANYDGDAMTAGLDILVLLKSFILTIFLFIGGLRLRALRRSGVSIIQWTLVAAFILGVISIFLYVVVGIGMPTSDAVMPAGVLIVTLGLLVVFTGEFAFMIAATIWLFRSGDSLELRQ